MLRGPGSQHALKKLQVEVKGIQKQLPERLTEFDDTLAQAKQAAADGSRPVKLLDELRRMRKNLERDRKKLRTYSSVKHVRSDAAQLRQVEEFLREIEERMLQDRLAERDLLTKAFSKDGLAREDRLDPALQALAECRNWVRDVESRLEARVEAEEARIEEEEASAGSRPRRTGRRAQPASAEPEIKDAQEWLRRHRVHIEKLRLVGRHLDNGGIEPGAVDLIREDLDYYLEVAEDPTTDPDYLETYGDVDPYEELLKEIEARARAAVVANTERDARAEAAAAARADGTLVLCAGGCGVAMALSDLRVGKTTCHLCLERDRERRKRQDQRQVHRQDEEDAEAHADGIATLPPAPQGNNVVAHELHRRHWRRRLRESLLQDVMRDCAGEVPKSKRKKCDAVLNNWMFRAFETGAGEGEDKDPVIPPPNPPPQLRKELERCVQSKFADVKISEEAAALAVNNMVKLCREAQRALRHARSRACGSDGEGLIDLLEGDGRPVVWEWTCSHCGTRHVGSLPGGFGGGDVVAQACRGHGCGRSRPVGVLTTTATTPDPFNDLWLVYEPLGKDHSSRIAINPSDSSGGDAQHKRNSNALRLYRHKLEELVAAYERRAAAEPQQEMRLVLTAIFCMLMRYESLFDFESGPQAAVPAAVFAEMHDRFGVRRECFASPLNKSARTDEFCSLFPDVDSVFGSHGSFFEAGGSFFAEGSFECNPPFDSDSIKRTFAQLEELLKRTDEPTLDGSSQPPLSFLVVVPEHGESRNLVEHGNLRRYLRTTRRLKEEAHHYLYGMQHRSDTGGDVQRHWAPNVPTMLYWLQNEAGAALYNRGRLEESADYIRTLWLTEMEKHDRGEGGVSSESRRQQRAKQGILLQAMRKPFKNAPWRSGAAGSGTLSAPAHVHTTRPTPQRNVPAAVVKPSPTRAPVSLTPEQKCVSDATRLLSPDRVQDLFEDPLTPMQLPEPALRTPMQMLRQVEDCGDELQVAQDKARELLKCDTPAKPGAQMLANDFQVEHETKFGAILDYRAHGYKTLTKFMRAVPGVECIGEGSKLTFRLCAPPCFEKTAPEGEVKEMIEKDEECRGAAAGSSQRTAEAKELAPPDLEEDPLTSLAGTGAFIGTPLATVTRATFKMIAQGNYSKQQRGRLVRARPVAREMVELVFELISTGELLDCVKANAQGSESLNAWAARCRVPSAAVARAMDIVGGTRAIETLIGATKYCNTNLRIGVHLGKPPADVALAFDDALGGALTLWTEMMLMRMTRDGKNDHLSPESMLKHKECKPESKDWPPLARLIHEVFLDLVTRAVIKEQQQIPCDNIERCDEAVQSRLSVPSPAAAQPARDYQDELPAHTSASQHLQALVPAPVPAPVPASMPSPASMPRPVPAEVMEAEKAPGLGLFEQVAQRDQQIAQMQQSEAAQMQRMLQMRQMAQMRGMAQFNVPNRMQMAQMQNLTSVVNQFGGGPWGPGPPPASWFRLSEAAQTQRMLQMRQMAQMRGMAQFDVPNRMQMAQIQNLMSVVNQFGGGGPWGPGPPPASWFRLPIPQQLERLHRFVSAPPPGALALPNKAPGHRERRRGHKVAAAEMARREVKEEAKANQEALRKVHAQERHQAAAAKARRAAEEEACRKAAAAETARRAAEEEARRKAAADETARRAAEEEARRKAAAAEKARRKAEEGAQAGPPGFVFFCNGQTERECLDRGLFGSGIKDWQKVQRVGPRTHLFLYNFRSKKLFGVFQMCPGTAPGRPLVSKAWGGKFPAQVHVQRIAHSKQVVQLSSKQASGIRVGELGEAKAQALLATFGACISAAPPASKAHVAKPSRNVKRAHAKPTQSTRKTNASSAGRAEKARAPAQSGAFAHLMESGSDSDDFESEAEALSRLARINAK